MHAKVLLSVFVASNVLAVAGCKSSTSDTPSIPSSTESKPTAPVTTGAPTVTTPAVTTTGPTATVPEEAPPCTGVASRAAITREARGGVGKPKIVGGTLSTSPFAVAITGNGKQSGQYCGGSLIGPNSVLTAAHCQVLTSDKVIVGRTDLTVEAQGKVVSIVEVRNHPQYDPDTHDNDVAVLKLGESVSLEPLALYEAVPDLAGSQATVIGWGVTKENGETSPKLREVAVPVVTNLVCTEGYKSDGVGITDNMLCAGLATGGKDSCQGDSGGPLVVKNGAGKSEQAGIVSFGIGCARPNKYGVYTRVSKFASWIAACSK